MLRHLRRRVASLCLVPVQSPRSRSLEGLSRLGGPNDEVYPSFREAWNVASDRACTDGGFVLVTGSLFLVADALAEITGEPRDPPVEG